VFLSSSKISINYGQKSYLRSVLASLVDLYCMACIFPMRGVMDHSSGKVFVGFGNETLMDYIVENDETHNRFYLRIVLHPMMMFKNPAI